MKNTRFYHPAASCGRCTANFPHPHGTFLKQVHRSWLVNPMYIQNLRRYFLPLTNQIQIPIGKSRYNEVREASNG
ncbi:MAG: LytTR family transcriptional regulator DNA-binding domain-containing protein [Lachnospiraceae bacterium]|nr:LytTR family transcriptional regulator DNA-binding domain-containing protein [Lachnospiraceae bacterium]